jgi:hypothetical protein
VTSTLLKKQSKLESLLIMPPQAITAWNQWTEFTNELGINPFLQALEDKVPVIQVFALRVCVGELAANDHPIGLAEAYYGMLRRRSST